MAAVLDALAPYVKQMIKDMAGEELRKMLGVSGEIAKLEGNVGSLEDYVADAERRRIDDARVQRWVGKLKGALYAATDILELCQLDAEERRHKQPIWVSMEKKAPGCLGPLLFCLRNPRFAYGMGGRIKELNASLEGIRQEMADFRFESLASFQVQAQPSTGGTPHGRATTSLIDESAIVGDAIKAATNSLVQELLAKEPKIKMKVVSITGAGGMGKTTLAKKIFNDKAIQVEFGCRIWLSVTESYSSEGLLSSAITQAGGGTDPRGDKQVLSQTLADALSSSTTGKFLLVLDDVWSNRSWSDVLQGPAVEAAGRRCSESRVIITTRNEHLVKDMGAPYYQHHVRPLHDEDAWSLLRKQLLLQGVGSESALDDLKQIGMGIIRNCDGLPLAIKAIGGLLRTKRATELEWNGVLHDPLWKTDKTHHDLNTALRLSYDDLSPQLKQCFLYCSLFPKGASIKERIVTGMWMSEGFIINKLQASGELGRKELEDVGAESYRDLITRNLIEPEKMFRDGSVSKMHDVIRSFAQYMAKEEALVVAGHDQISGLVSSPKIRRLSIELSDESESGSLAVQNWSRISEKQEHLRSLIIHGRMTFEPSASDSSMSRFSSIRALFVRHAGSDKFVESLAKLKHLRFLYLEVSDIRRLPDDIDKMKFLEYICIDNCASFDGQIPSSVQKLEGLRYLRIGSSTKFIVPKGLGGLTNLRTLGDFPAQMDGEWCSLQELGPLSLLRKLTLDRLQAVPSGSLSAKAKLHDKVQLRVLFLACYKYGEAASIGDQVTEQDCNRVEEVFDQLRPPPHLELLRIQNYIGCRVPNWLGMAAAVDLNSLTGLEMVRLHLCTQLPDGLCRLPSLESLVIDFAPAIRHVGPQFQRRTSSGSSSARTTTTPFPKLKYIGLDELLNLEEWEWEEEEESEVVESIAMPALQTLYIRRCKLGRLPGGLASGRRLALRLLVLYNVTRITAVEGFPSVVELDARHCPSLNTIRGFTSMQSLTVMLCPELEVLELGGSALDTVQVSDPAMETLPEYLRGLTLRPRILRVDCHKRLRKLLLSADGSAEYLAEMDKLKHYRGKLLL